jgi:hypothetical protein
MLGEQHSAQVRNMSVVRNRSQMASSDAPTSCLSSSSASKTRVGTGWRPPLARLGKRLAKLCSTAWTNFVQRNVSVHWRMELVLRRGKISNHYVGISPGLMQ